MFVIFNRKPQRRESDKRAARTNRIIENFIAAALVIAGLAALWIHRADQFTGYGS